MSNRLTTPPTRFRRQERPPASSLKQKSISAFVSIALIGFVLTYLVGPAAWQWSVANDRRAELSDYTDEVFEQFTNIVAPPSNAELVALLKAAPAGQQAGPMILTYHDIGYNSSEYTVTPEAFAAQMQLLADAGWQTLSAEQLSNWLDGMPLPPHSVQITFDDGAHGIWQYADPILARNNQRATAYIITGYVGTRKPYYVTWSELGRMYDSGRWDIQAHTHKGHTEIAIDAEGHTGPFLTNLQFLPDRKRTETPAEFRNRIASDLQESKNQLMAHGFPEPKFFAYPFSAHSEVSSVDGVLGQTISSMFRAAMLDTPHAVVAPRPAELAAGNVDRMDITSDVSASMYAARVLAASPLSPAGLEPLAMSSEWTTYKEEPAALTLDPSGGAKVDPGPEAYLSRLFAPLKAGLWTQYTVDALLGGFEQANDGTSTGLTVLTKDPQQVDLSVSANSFKVSQADGSKDRILAQGVLPVATSHRAEVAVTRNSVDVTIDGQRVSSTQLRDTGMFTPAGTFQITGYRESEASPVPRILSLSIH